MLNVGNNCFEITNHVSLKVSVLRWVVADITTII